MNATEKATLDGYLLAKAEQEREEAKRQQERADADEVRAILQMNRLQAEHELRLAEMDATMQARMNDLRRQMDEQIAAREKYMAERRDAEPEPPPAPVATPEEAAFRHDMMQGIGDQQPLTAEFVAALDMREYAELRQRLGIGQGQGVLGPIGH